jgi:leader peptidase (prepilin peptidase)/N-methyltransferase
LLHGLKARGTELSHFILIIFLFALGACIGSFLNVVVWRLPRGESIVSPPSRCPKCGRRLAWRDNIPVLGWIALRGRCRYCGQAISLRYPIVEAVTGALFVLYYVAMFVYQQGPCAQRPMSIAQDWPIYLFLYMPLIAALLAASLIDAELFIIPIEIPWLVGALGLLVHTLIDTPLTPGALNATAPVGAASAGAGIGLIVSILLLRRGLVPQSFAEGGPLLEIEKEALKQKQERDAGSVEQEPILEFTRAQIREEMGKEMLFLMPSLVLASACLLLYLKVPPVARLWEDLMRYHWLSGLLGSLWGALVGAFIVWLTRILGSIAFGREAMGMGDVHLMFGVGAVIGAAGATVVFFLAPFAGLLFALWKLITRRGRELPYGPFLSLATAVVVLFYCPIISHLTPQVSAVIQLLQQQLAGE